MKTHTRAKILYIVEAMGGGVFTYIVDLTNALSKHFDMYVAYAVRPQTPKNYQSYFDKNVHLIEVKHFRRSINPLSDVKSIFEIKQIARKVKPDLIHLHSSKAGAIGRVVFDGKNIPLFYTPHGYSFLMSDHSRVKRSFYYVVEKALAKRRCTTISCSAGEHEESLRLTQRAVYVNNGINTEEIDRVLSDVKKEEHPFTVFTIGRICPQKNPRLFNQIAASLPEMPFVWIGDGELRNELNAPNIRITGWIQRENVLKEVASMDAFLLTSLWEGLPISLLEAMYMKKVCAVSNVIGNRDVISDGENGFVCRTVEEFVKALKLAQNGQAEPIKTEAKRTVEQEYTVSVMKEKYQEIYEKALIPRGGVKHSDIISLEDLLSVAASRKAVA